MSEICGGQHDYYAVDWKRPHEEPETVLVCRKCGVVKEIGERDERKEKEG